MRADDAAAATDDREAGFEDRPPLAVAGAGTPELRLGAWEGPLDLLLELARARKVDLSRLSILDLAEQFGAALEAAVARRRVPLSRLADWLVMAAHLALLRSRLLLPADSAEAVEARREAEALRRRLADREFVRRLADWLERRPRLGRDVFARGAAEEEPEGADLRGATPPAADTAALLRACLAVLERPDRGGSWRPAPLPLWRVPDALARLRRMLPAIPEGAPLERFLPEMAEDGSGDVVLRRRAALASTLLAGLEMGREGAASLSQGQAFGAVVVVPAVRPESAHADPQAEVNLDRRPRARLATS
jgi:segregation and condensation protein A